MGGPMGHMGGPARRWNSARLTVIVGRCSASTIKSLVDAATAVGLVATWPGNCVSSPWTQSRRWYTFGSSVWKTSVTEETVGDVRLTSSTSRCVCVCVWARSAGFCRFVGTGTQAHRSVSASAGMQGSDTFDVFHIVLWARGHLSPGGLLSEFHWRHRRKAFK